jgi:hypothetical protein
MTSAQSYKAFQVLCVVALLGWTVAYGYESNLRDQCIQSFQQLSEINQVRITNVQARIEKVRAREESLQTRSNELINKLNSPDGDAGSK